MHDRLQSTLRQLRLSGLAQTLDVRLRQQAGAGSEALAENDAASSKQKTTKAAAPTTAPA